MRIVLTLKEHKRIVGNTVGETLLDRGGCRPSATGSMKVNIENWEGSTDKDFNLWFETIDVCFDFTE